MKRSNQGQFDKARKMLPDFDKQSGSGANLDGTKMDKTAPKALRLANGGAARQPRTGSMKFVKRDMGGPITAEQPGSAPAPLPFRRTPVIDGQDQMMRNPPALGIGATQPGGRFNRPGLARIPPGEVPMAPPVEQMGGTDQGGGFKRGGKIAVPRNKAARHSTKEDAADKRADAISAKKAGMKAAAFEGSAPDEKMDRAGARPFKTGGSPKPIRRAMGGVGNIRHDEAQPSGKPKAAPKGKSVYEVI